MQTVISSVPKSEAIERCEKGNLTEEMRQDIMKFISRILLLAGRLSPICSRN